MPRAVNSEEKSVRRRPPAVTPIEREDRMIAMAFNLAEKKLADGTASNQMIIHYLKLGSERERLEKEKLIKENELLRAKTEALESAKNVEELYRNAIKAMRIYSGEAKE